MTPVVHDEAAEVAAAYLAGATTAELADAYTVSSQTIRRWLHDAGVTVYRGRPANNPAARAAKASADNYAPITAAELVAHGIPGDDRWRAAAACRGEDPATFYVGVGEPIDRAVMLCAACPVRLDCAAHATLEARERHGFWGGLAPMARRRIRAELGLSHLPEAGE